MLDASRSLAVSHSSAAAVVRLPGGAGLPDALPAAGERDADERDADERDGGGAAPPPAVADRHNGWTRARMVGFLRELAASQSVAFAAKSVWLSRQSAYALRNRLAGTPFALAWEVALEAGLQQLAHAVMDRAVNGAEVPHYYKGELVGTHRKHDNRLATWLLVNPGCARRTLRSRDFDANEWHALLEQIGRDGVADERDEPPPGEA